MIDADPPDDDEQVVHFTPVTITARDLREIVQRALDKDDPEFCRKLLAAASSPSPASIEATPSVDRAYAWARQTLARYLAERDLVANLPPGRNR